MALSNAPAPVASPVKCITIGLTKVIAERAFLTGHDKTRVREDVGRIGRAASPSD